MIAVCTFRAIVGGQEITIKEGEEIAAEVAVELDLKNKPDLAKEAVSAKPQKP